VAPYLFLCNCEDSCPTTIGNTGARAIAAALQRNVALTKISLPYKLYKIHPVSLAYGLDIKLSAYLVPLVETTRIIDEQIENAIKDKMKTNKQLQCHYRQTALAASFALYQGFWKKTHVANERCCRLPYLPREIVKYIVEMAKPEPGDVPRAVSLSLCAVQ
jgi:hypothetical protein